MIDFVDYLHKVHISNHPMLPIYFDTSNDSILSLIFGLFNDI